MVYAKQRFLLLFWPNRRFMSGMPILRALTVRSFVIKYLSYGKFSKQCRCH